MSVKNLDRHNQWRNITVGFRVSPEERDAIDKAVYLSGHSKQEYCCRKCMNRDIVIQGNPRVYKALKTNMEQIYTELKRITDEKKISPEMLETLNLIAITLGGLKNNPDKV